MTSLRQYAAVHTGRSTDTGKPRAFWWGCGLALLAVMIWAGNFVAARGLGDEVSPVALSFWRWTIATAVLVPFVARAPVAQWRLCRAHVGYLCLTGFLGVAAFNTLVYIAGRTTSATNLALLAVAAPVFIVLLARVLDRTPITGPQLAGTVIALGGVGALITGGTLIGLRWHSGDLWMLLGTLTFACYSLLVRRKPPELGNSVFLASIFGVGTLFLLPLYLGDLLLLGGRMPLDGRVLWSLLYVGVLSSAVAFAAWNRSIEIIGASRAGFLYYLTPVATALAAWLVLGERAGWVQGAAMLLIVCGVFVSNHAPTTGRTTSRGPETGPGK
ncbi:DMT family transporter [Saccharopolyspora gloriosae]|uniref:Drug/metabolite transporter (DMT)-like permease n=1 Tax=Saccharopolyspora gloriosae TaxID=455344 RepID=A0A840NF92_9PSEU|nr:DMT family transporter [Saccharopolyspora gloriosae]MBB5067989.1 drug/metabolite transporter (DMT)-like permease [Saccharopolyspora gloriosae]